VPADPWRLYGWAAPEPVTTSLAGRTGERRSWTPGGVLGGGRHVKVAAVLASKSRVAATIKPTDTIAALCDVLAKERVGAAVVSRDGVVIDGVITERDITFGLARHKDEMLAKPVASVMTKDVITCKPGDDVGQVASTMLSRNFRHIPVEDGGRYVGMVSIRDVLKSRVDELNQQTALLRTYAGNSGTPVEDRG
jgi:CBS domain-containing protein